MIGSLSPSESRLVLRAVRVVWIGALCRLNPSLLQSRSAPHQVTWFSEGIWSDLFGIQVDRSVVWIAPSFGSLRRLHRVVWIAPSFGSLRRLDRSVVWIAPSFALLRRFDRSFFASESRHLDSHVVCITPSFGSLRRLLRRLHRSVVSIRVATF